MDSQQKGFNALYLKDGQTEEEFSSKPEIVYWSLNCTFHECSEFNFFVEANEDEYLSFTLGFRDQRHTTKMIKAAPYLEVNESFTFQFVDKDDPVELFPANLLNINEPIQVTVLLHTKNEKPYVLGIKNIEWRQVLFENVF